MPAELPSQYDFQAGFDFSALSSVTKVQLLQSIAQVMPLLNIGGVIFLDGDGGNIWPGTANNSRFNRYLWIDLDTSPPALKLHDQGGNTYANWVSVGLSTGAVITDFIDDLAVTVAKIAPSATGLQVLRTNAGHTAVEWVAPNSLMGNNDVLLNTIDITGVPDPNSVLRTTAGVTTWQSITNFAAAALAALSSIAETKIEPGADGQVLVTDAGMAAWLDFTLARLGASGAAAGQYAKYDGANWIAASPPLGTMAESDPLGTLTALVAAPLTWVHGLAAEPKIVQPYLECIIADAATAYAIGDKLDPYGLFDDDAEKYGLFSWTHDVSTFTLYFSVRSASTLKITHLTSGVQTAPTSKDNFVLKCRAWI